MRHYFHMPSDVRESLALRGINPDASTDAFLRQIRRGDKPLPERLRTILGAHLLAERDPQRSVPLDDR